MNNRIFSAMPMAGRVLWVLFVLLFVYGCTRDREEVVIDVADSTVADREVEDGLLDGQETEESICVYICGRVANPGVYEMKVGSRIYELLARCGGYAPGADTDFLNQAQPLSDGEKISVPAREDFALAGIAAAGEDAGKAVELTPGVGGKADAQTEQDTVNINTADLAQLQTLTGIGASRAADIIAYREKEGFFKSIEDIKKVNGIKEGLFSKIKDRIRI